MIQSINFMGREECLTKPAKKAVDKTHEYLGASAIIENNTPKVIENSKKIVDEEAAKLNDAIKAKYAPFTLAESSSEADAIAKDWAIAHGNPVK